MARLVFTEHHSLLELPNPCLESWFNRNTSEPLPSHFLHVWYSFLPLVLDTLSSIVVSQSLCFSSQYSCSLELSLFSNSWHLQFLLWIFSSFSYHNLRTPHFTWPQAEMTFLNIGHLVWRWHGPPLPSHLLLPLPPHTSHPFLSITGTWKAQTPGNTADVAAVCRLPGGSLPFQMIPVMLWLKTTFLGLIWVHLLP